MPQNDLRYARSGLLHVRGGVSNAAPVRGGIRLVFSTSVEVFPSDAKTRIVPVSLLHVRGGVSPGTGKSHLAISSSPRPWRCFPLPELYRAVPIVFSTSVEVFPMPPFRQEA